MCHLTQRKYHFCLRTIFQGTWKGISTVHAPDGSETLRDNHELCIFANGLCEGDVPQKIEMTMYKESQGRIVGRQYYSQGIDLLQMQGKVFNSNGDMCYGKVNDFAATPIVEQNLNRRNRSSGRILARVRVVTMFNAERLCKFIMYRENEFQEMNVGWKHLLLGRWDSIGDVHGLDGVTQCSGTRVGKTKGNGIEVNFGQSGQTACYEPLGKDERNARVVNPGSTYDEMLFTLCGGVWVRTSSLLRESIVVELLWLIEKNVCVRVSRRYVNGKWHSSRFLTERKKV